MVVFFRHIVVYFLCICFSLSGFAQSSELAPVNVVADKETDKLSTRGHSQGDALKLLKESPSVHTQTGGGISSLPVMKGVASDRVSVKVDGAGITASCPNHMNPALSYVTSSQVESIQAIAGVTPVSIGGDSLGGTIVVKSQLPNFRGGLSDKSISTSLSSLYGSNEDYLNLSARLSYANVKDVVGYEGTTEKARDYSDGHGKMIKRTLYEQNSNGLFYGRKLADGVLSFRFKHTEVPKEGFVNQPMDLLGNTSTRYAINYDGLIAGYKSEFLLSHQDVDHYMNIINDYQQGEMPMYTRSRESSVALKTHLLSSETSDVLVGVEANVYLLDDWWPPINAGMGMMSPNTYVNINAGQRNRYAFFIENERQWNPQYKTNLGARVDVVDMNTGDVRGYNDTMNSPVDQAYFNGLDRKKTDANFDLTWLNEYRASDSQSIKLALGRKSRSPNLYERYAWGGLQSNLATTPGARMDMFMINWFGDGNGYVGNPNLKPEVSHILSLGYEYQPDHKVSFEFTPYYSEIQNYIDADLKYAATSGMDAGTNYLQFANHDAVIYGAELASSFLLTDSELWGSVKLKSIASYTRGYRKDGASDLYNQMPLNGKIILLQKKDRWKSEGVVNLMSAKETVSSIRSENATKGYATLDLSTTYDWGLGFTSLVQIQNVFDTYYDLPLGGKNLLNDRSNVAGKGRSFVLGFSYDL